jgi:hypothetical protein
MRSISLQHDVPNGWVQLPASIVRTRFPSMSCKDIHIDTLCIFFGHLCQPSNIKASVYHCKNDSADLDYAGT